MKKDKKWLLHEVRKLPYELQNGHGKIKVVDIFPLLDQLDEPEKVVIPRFVADHIELCKSKNKRLNVALSKSPESKMVFEMGVSWEEANEIYGRAWLDGYEVEKEKLYIVQLPTNLEDDLIILDADGDIWKDSWPSRYKMTEKRIKEIDERYWPFAKEVAE